MAEPGVSLPKMKQTELGLYVTATEAYDMWKADPEKVIVLDVRTREEYLFVGHPTMGWLIPAFEQVYVWDAANGRFPMRPLPDFVERVKAVASPDVTILAMCRSGGRSALAANMLAKAGFGKVYSIVDGMEGDRVADPESVFCGMPMKNGWKNAGCPWTYDVNINRMSISDLR